MGFFQHPVKTAIFLGLLFLWSVGYAKGETGLFHDEVNIKVKEGKDLVMTFDEVERQDRVSIVKVKRTSGASVPSIMFVVKGCYQIAKSRKLPYFINLKEWTDTQGNWVYKIGFSSDKTVNPKTYFGPDIDSKKDLLFMSVEDYDLLWGAKR
jgi:hypothetical protein